MTEPDPSNAESDARAVLIETTEPDERVMTAFAVAEALTDPEQMAPAVLRAVILRRDEFVLMQATVAQIEREGVEGDEERCNAILAALRPLDGEAHGDWFERIECPYDVLRMLVEGLMAGIVLGADLRFKVSDAVDVKMGSVFVDVKPGEELTEAQMLEAIEESVSRAETDDDDGPEDDRGLEERGSDD